MRLRGMERCLQQKEINDRHRRLMDSIVEECQNGNYTNLASLQGDYAVNEILRRNCATKADLERWQAAAKEQQENKPPKKQKLGVCCSCQRAHPVVPNPKPEDDEEAMPGFELDEVGQYVMARHMMYGDSGPWCEGEGDIPQALVND